MYCFVINIYTKCWIVYELLCKQLMYTYILQRRHVPNFLFDRALSHFLRKKFVTAT